MKLVPVIEKPEYQVVFDKEEFELLTAMAFGYRNMRRELEQQFAGTGISLAQNENVQFMANLIIDKALEWRIE